MKKILNNPEEFVADMLDGLYKAHPDQVTYVDDIHSLVRADAPVEGKVGLMTGGGSGHLPVFLGYVGKGMLDGCAIGDVFQSPSVEQIANVTKRINSGKGVVYIYGNYGGDVMNFDMAAEVVAMDDIETRTVLVRDDVASAPPEEADRRRGVAGMVFAFKIAGAKADKGASIDEVVEVTERALANIRTIGVGPLASDAARRRHADLYHRRGRDGDRHGHPRRAWHEAREAADRRRDRRADDQRHP